MVLFRNSPPASGQVGVNHAFGVTGLESLVRRTRVCLRAMPLISYNLQKITTLLDRKRISALYEIADGHELNEA
jgi:hypothetical protein